MSNNSAEVVRMPVPIIAVLLLVAGLPMLIAAWGQPLVPPELAQTPSAFAPTAMAHRTREAEEEYNRPSVVNTLPPDEQFSEGATNPRIIEQAETPPTPTPTIPIPRMITATPLPPVEKTLTITAQEAAQGIAADIEEITEPRVTFSPPDQLLIKGVVKRPVLFGSIAGELTILGQLAQRETQLVVTITQLSLNGIDMTAERRESAEAAVNAWIRGRYLINRDVLSFRIENNTVIVEALEYSTRRSPSLPAQATPTALSENSPTPSLIPPQLSTPTLTVTPTLNLSERIFTDETATQLAREKLTFVRDPQVRFTPEGIELSGKIPLAFSPLAPEVLTTFRFVGTLGIQDGRLSVTPKVLEISLAEAGRTSLGRQLVEAIEGWLSSAFISAGVESFKLQGGKLLINVAEPR